MANNLEKAKKYIPVLDKKYAVEAKTSVLDTTTEIEYISKAGQFLIPDRDISGLGNYDRNNGFSKGSVTTKYTAYTPDYERSISYQVDVMDNDEAQGLAMLGLADDLYTYHAGPEIDTVRIAKYAGIEGITKKTETIADSEGLLASIRTMKNDFDENGIPEGDRYLFISPTLYNGVKDLDTYKSKAALEGLNIITIPQARLKTAITLKPGTDDGGWGFEIPGEAKNINFICIQKKSVFQFYRHVTARFYDATVNQNADADLFQYRMLAMQDAYKGKLNGIWVSVAE